MSDKQIVEKHVYINESTYDKYFPLITIYFDKYIEEPYIYREVHQKLLNVDEKTKVRFIINTPGGDLFSTIELVDIIRQTKAKTEAVIYRASSAGSVIACCCNIINPRPNCMMMIHNLQWSDSRIKDMNKHKWRIDHYIDIVYELFTDVYKGFLTEDEIKKIVFEGYELWLKRDEIIERAKKAGKEIIQDL